MSKLGRRAGRQAGTSAALPMIEPRLSTEKVYYSALRSVLNQIATETRESIIPLYQAERGQKRAQGALLADADGFWFSRVQMLAVALARNASNTVNRILDLEAQRHTSTFIETARRALGVNLAAVVQQEDLDEHLRIAVARGASLIQGLSADMAKRIELAVYENSLAGNSVATLRKRLQKEFSIGDSRAKLIARTETSRFNASLNQMRQEQAGVTSYTWTTSHDERVRERHRQLDGKVYKWGQATGAEGGLPPGQPINCRCIARGVVKF
ncbi:minor capsid protein [Rhizobium pusense]|uniref:phage head morphogenesis protein n=1 Tax=Agrobacterium pusense TaxID=648995 RepID=UPI0024474FA5|nr:minor capsid protein [Agrobacterium pusense]MDH2092297.1 minor capsid protein [Agrobacterium pusense]